MKPVVFVEGGGAPNDKQLLPIAPSGVTDLIQNDPIGTRQALTDALYSLFEKAAPDMRVLFDISLSGGYRETIDKYVKVQQNSGDSVAFLMIDYQDLSGNSRAEKYITLQQEVNAIFSPHEPPSQTISIVDQVNSIFFMVQKMDAWILSQPAIIDLEFPNAKKNTQRVNERITSFGTRPSEVRNPDDELQYLFNCYQEERKGKWSKLKYGKIKTSVRLLPRLDVEQLQRDFVDVQQFVEMLRSLAL